MTEKALASGADPLAPDWQGRAALWHAASTPSLVQLILDSQAWPTEGFNAGGALHRACELGHVESARIMLAHGANLLDVKHTRSPLHAACRGGHVECVKMLLERGADPNVVDAWGNTPMMEACRRIGAETVAVVTELLLGGADASRRNQHGEVALGMLFSPPQIGIEQGRCPAEPPGEKRTKIMLAAMNLTAAGVDLNKPSASGQSLALAAASRAEWMAVGRLSTLGADVGAECAIQDCFSRVGMFTELRAGCSPTLCAAASGDLEGILTLGELGVDLFAANCQGLGAEELAKKYGRTEVAEALAALKEKRVLEEEQSLPSPEKSQSRRL